MELEREAGVPLRIGHLEQIEPCHRACDIDQRVDAAEAIQRGLDDFISGIRRGEIELERQRRAAASFDLLSGLAQPLAAARDEDDGGKSRASRSAAARPMPELAPVTMATDWVMCISLEWSA
ncbi:hypothetical protein SAMN05216337_100489 [Bradyrhizobium brasilense]|uniref:Uncharacterized protein n=1 Tax=Bradyrhizobium brasilense TaxID=1419277 RepID=A0A1G6NEE1_9BRAD|nr:hypothetical protein SAMN05216337_100489 [Bradyrhizobium brasilense]